MEAGKKEKIKLYLVIGLAFILMLSLFFRFVKHGNKGIEVEASQRSPDSRYITPDLESAKAPDSRAPRAKAELNEDLQSLIRDIFKPMETSPKASDKSPGLEAPKPLASLNLKGTIVGKKGSIALIDDQFLRPGDWIGGYKVTSIGKKEVLLDSGDQKIRLEIMKNE